MPSLPPRLTAPAWGFGSAAPSLNRMAAACGPPTTLRAAQVFALLYPPQSTHMKTTARLGRICLSAGCWIDLLRTGRAAINPNFYLRHRICSGEGRQCAAFPWAPTPADKIVVREVAEKVFEGSSAILFRIFDL